MKHRHSPEMCPDCDGAGEVSDGTKLARGQWAWCVSCRGTGLANSTCEGCEKPTAFDTLDRTALELQAIVIHAEGCDTGDTYFDNRPAPSVWSFT